MGKVLPEGIDDDLRAWIAAQPMAPRQPACSRTVQDPEEARTDRGR